ncbi:hypothetical protein CPB84DRAFT_1749464 [Gymnopilus junonius]|uniref:Uncharacterized protein n=1 Tax=Gymnopilus junonius TaxID=109634 RepID=A0A9P5TKW9_GYMJU|nr:hypothetical protein CPB84DRAFT_1749464 [Gymnopilus junonius]
MDTLATGGLSQKYGVNWLAMKPPQLSTVIEFCMTPEGAQNVHHIPLMLIWRTWWTGVALIKLEIDGIPDCGWDAASRLYSNLGLWALCDRVGQGRAEGRAGQVAGRTGEIGARTEAGQRQDK